MSSVPANQKRQSKHRPPTITAMAAASKVKRARLQRISDHRKKGYGILVRLADREGFWILEFVFLHKKNTSVLLAIPRGARPELMRQLVDHLQKQVAAIAERDLKSKKNSKAAR